MTAVSSVGLVSGALATPVPITPAASDTIAEAQFGANGCLVRVITTGTATNVSITDANLTILGNLGTSASLTCPATGARMLPIPRSAIASATQVATVTFSGALTGVTYELYRY